MGGGSGVDLLARREDEGGDQGKEAPHAQEGHVDAAQGLPARRHRHHGPGGKHPAGQQDVRAQPRPQGRAQRVEGLGEDQAEVR